MDDYPERDHCKEHEKATTFPKSGDNAWWQGIPCKVNSRVYGFIPFKVIIDFYDGKTKNVEQSEITKRK